MRGHEHAHIYPDGLVSADAFDLAFFEHAQQLGLHGERHVADFIEENGALLGLLEFAQVAIGGAGERSFFVAEEFGFDQLRWNRGAI